MNSASSSSSFAFLKLRLNPDFLKLRLNPDFVKLQTNPDPDSVAQRKERELFPFSLPVSVTVVSDDDYDWC